VIAARHVGYDEAMAVCRDRRGAGIRFVQFNCASASAAAEFYASTFRAVTSTYPDVNGVQSSTVCVGPSQHFIFRSSPDAARLFGKLDSRGVHVCIYVSRFSDPYHCLKAKGLIWTNPRFEYLDRCDTYEEAAQSRQFRFKQIVASDGSDVLELEHETRSCRHGQYRKIVNFDA
jgi:hypothetical protein